MYTFEFTQDDLKGTLVLNALNTKKQYIINGYTMIMNLMVHKGLKKHINDEIVNVKKAAVLKLNADDNDQCLFDIIDSATPGEKFIIFDYNFKKDVLRGLKLELDEIFKTINPRALFIKIMAVNASETFTEEDGNSLREYLPLDIVYSPIVLDDFKKDFFSRIGVNINVVVLVS
jgi:hypothetical protein